MVLGLFWIFNPFNFWCSVLFLCDYFCICKIYILRMRVDPHAAIVLVGFYVPSFGIGLEFCPQQYQSLKCVWKLLIQNNNHIPEWPFSWLTHCSPVITFEKYVNSSGNGLSHVSRQAIAQIDADILSIGPGETNSSEIWIKVQRFSFTKKHLKKSFVKKIGHLFMARYLSTRIRATSKKCWTLNNNIWSLTAFIGYISRLALINAWRLQFTQLAADDVASVWRSWIQSPHGVWQFLGSWWVVSVSL